jgi:class 3 adenylate cyclase
MICPRCGAKVADHKKFCGDCGSPLPWRCSACGSENPADKRFCSDCGAAAFRAKPEGPLAPAAPQPSAELRQLTVMFVDLVGSTALSARLDPEDLRDVMAAYDGSVTGLVARFDGFVARYLGDGVLAYFGYPQAHEDDAERAIRTGLAIVNAVAQLATIAGPAGTLSARVAIASGLVMVGDLIGSEAIGDTPNLAARLQAAAEAGTVVISSATRRLTGDLFEYRELALPDVKGRRAPERAWVVLGESVIESRFEALRGTRLHLVGRTEELELLRRRWEQAKTGEGRVVLLRGEPGIGKSRRKSVQTLHQRGATALQDVIAGRLDLIFDNITASLPHVRSGVARGLAVTAAKRVPAAPHLPTIAEAGVPGFDVSTWFAFFRARQDAARHH